MRLYHSSNVPVEKPDTKHSRLYLDFGRGFYLTSLHEQAVRYAQRFKRRGQQAWLNTYDLNCYAKEWLDFVAQCRDGKDFGYYDLVVGGIANDRVIITLDRYFTGDISQEKALGLLRFEKPNIQYCIRSEQMLKDCLTFIESKEL